MFSQWDNLPDWAVNNFDPTLPWNERDEDEEIDPEDELPPEWEMMDDDFPEDLGPDPRWDDDEY
jgi:hypothetical protein